MLGIGRALPLFYSILLTLVLLGLDHIGTDHGNVVWLAALPIIVQLVLAILGERSLDCLVCAIQLYLVGNGLGDELGLLELGFVGDLWDQVLYYGQDLLLEDIVENTIGTHYYDVVLLQLYLIDGAILGEILTDLMVLDSFHQLLPLLLIQYGLHLLHVFVPWHVCQLEGGVEVVLLGLRLQDDEGAVLERRLPVVGD